MTNESGLREKITTLIDDSESNIYWAVEMGRTFDKKLLVDQIIALISPAGEVSGWRDIAEHDNSATEVLIETVKGEIMMAWRHHPSSRTDIWLSIPGRYQVKPVRFCPVSAAPRGMEG